MASCPACKDNPGASSHECIICKKKVHALDECSFPVKGQEEKYGEKRLCIKCSKSKFLNKKYFVKIDHLLISNVGKLNS